MWELDYRESWAPKNWCFWTVVLEKTLESLLDCKEIYQSTLREISSENSLEGLMLKLKLQYFGHLMWRTDSLEKTLMLRKTEGRRRRGRKRMRWLECIKIEGRRRRGRKRMRWLDCITNSNDMSLSSSGSWWWREKPGILHSMGSQRVDRTEQLNCTELTLFFPLQSITPTSTTA